MFYNLISNPLYILNSLFFLIFFFLKIHIHLLYYIYKDVYDVDIISKISTNNLCNFIKLFQLYLYKFKKNHNVK